jgi:phage terminase large subunit-like protein
MMSDSRPKNRPDDGDGVALDAPVQERQCSRLESLARRLGGRALFERLSPDERAMLPFLWPLWARPEQLEPEGDWTVWLCLWGRGAGKTRTGAEWVRGQVARGAAKRIALVGRTATDVRDVMVEGKSGLLSVCPPEERPKYEPSKRRLTWPSGAVATTFSADEPNVLRGPEYDLAWCDELAAWNHEEAWSNLRMGLRLGDRPRCLVTTTPRPTHLVRQLIEDPRTVTSRSSTFANQANLASAFLDEMKRNYENTRLGRQELHGEVLDVVEGALWTPALIDSHRISKSDAPTEFANLVIGVDPSVSANPGADETGMVVAAQVDGGYYVLADYSQRASPNQWASRVVSAYYTHNANLVVAEANNGGEMVRATIHSVDDRVPVKLVHATQGKWIRAEPIHALYEQGKVHHVGALFGLEDQLCTWRIGDRSPDRLDALVWALTELRDRGEYKPPVAKVGIIEIPNTRARLGQADADDDDDIDEYEVDEAGRRWRHVATHVYKFP